MYSRGEKGFTRYELIAVGAVVTILVLALYPAIMRAAHVSGSVIARIKARQIWAQVIGANAEREPWGLPPVWPRDLGFDATRTSTEYFRLLMSDDPAAASNGVHRPICEGLQPMWFGCRNSGIPCADSIAHFTSANNAWQVICVGAETSTEKTAFLVTRNVDMGAHVNKRTTLKLNNKSSFSTPAYETPNGVFITCGGACFDLPEKYLNCGLQGSPSYGTGLLNGLDTNITYDVMQP